MAPPRSNPALVAQAVAAVLAGTHYDVAGAAVGISGRTIRRAVDAYKAANPAPVTAAPLAPALAPSGRSQAPVLPPAPAGAPQVPSGLTGTAADMWILDHEIAATREQLHKARANGTTHGLAALGSNLARLLDRRAEIRPPEVIPDAVLEELRRLDAGAIAKLEEHLEQPISAAEVFAA